MIKALSMSLALALAGTSLAAHTQTPPPPPPPEAKTTAMPYVMAAGMSDLYEINSSQVALEKTRNPAIRSFANMLIKHHTKTTAATMKAARKAGLSPAAPMLDPGHAAATAELRAASADSFDHVYLSQQVPAHQAAVDLHRSYGANGDQAPLRMSAKSAVPIVRQHLTAAERMMRGMGHSGHRGM